jgi:hypothetical protein
MRDRHYGMPELLKKFAAGGRLAGLISVRSGAEYIGCFQTGGSRLPGPLADSAVFPIRARPVKDPRSCLGFPV